VEECWAFSGSDTGGEEALIPGRVAGPPAGGGSSGPGTATEAARSGQVSSVPNTESQQGSSPRFPTSAIWEGMRGLAPLKGACLEAGAAASLATEAAELSGIRLYLNTAHFARFRNSWITV
jgi:hypothetical protein